MNPQEKKFKILMEDFGQFFIDAYNDMFTSEGFDKLRQKLYDEHSMLINAVKITVDLNEGGMNVDFSITKIASDEKPAKPTKPSQGETRSPPLIKITTKEESVLAHGLGIQLDDNDIGDIEKACAASTNADESTQETNSKSDQNGTDTRSVEKIIKSLKILAQKLNFNSRYVLAETFNTDRIWKRLEVQFPDNEMLQDDITWLSKIQEVINQVQEKIQDVENIKKLLIILEKLMLIALESQKK